MRSYIHKDKAIMVEQKMQRIGSSKRRVPQQISIPFLWEEKPGTARGQWPLPPQQDVELLLPLPSPPPGGAVVPSRPPPPPPPAKFVVSIPFKWEEKPGTPFRSFTRDPSVAAPPKCKNLPLPPAYYSQFLECFDSDQESSYGDGDEPDWLAELDRDASSSAPSLLANRLVPESVVSSAVPFEDDDDSSSIISISSSDSDSYDTGSTSPVGNAFLEQLFPRYTAKPSSPTPAIKAGARSEPRRQRSVAFRRPQTLGDLIMLSRRRSYMQKAAGITKFNTMSKEFEDQNAIGCCVFGSGKGGIAKFLGGRSLLSLKFV